MVQRPRRSLMPPRSVLYLYSRREATLYSFQVSGFTHLYAIIDVHVAGFNLFTLYTSTYISDARGRMCHVVRKPLRCCLGVVLLELSHHRRHSIDDLVKFFNGKILYVTSVGFNPPLALAAMNNDSPRSWSGNFMRSTDGKRNPYSRLCFRAIRICQQ